MNTEEKEIKRLLNETQDYFGKDEKICIFKCKKCHKLEPVPSFVINEQIGFLKFIKKESTPKMDCPYCGSTMLPLDLKNWSFCFNLFRVCLILLGPFFI